MSRKDYEAIAAGFLAERDYWLDESINPSKDEAKAAIHALRLMAQRAARIYESDNPRFDRARFLRACGF